ncbi:MAG: hypothetical protein QM578_24870 [Pantoea sp.]|uniref:hypothetical protein n=1 Tax=Pantoea sp. TaxID=69393 RepID=UPI0039E6B3C6
MKSISTEQTKGNHRDLVRKIIKCISVVLAIFFGAYLLNGAGVAFPSWFAAPTAIAKFIVMIIVLTSLVKTMILIANFLYNWIGTPKDR